LQEPASEVHRKQPGRAAEPPSPTQAASRIRRKKGLMPGTEISKTWPVREVLKNHISFNFRHPENLSFRIPVLDPGLHALGQTN
jgi:hypothetical protein